MQLLLILALLMYGGKNGSTNVLEEVKPVLETFGGEEIKEALKSAEEISGMLSAVKTFSGNGLFGGKEGEAEQVTYNKQKSNSQCICATIIELDSSLCFAPSPSY